MVLLQDAHDDDHEGSGGAAYLICASAEQGDEEPGHNGGDEALGWGAVSYTHLDVYKRQVTEEREGGLSPVGNRVSSAWA